MDGSDEHEDVKLYCRVTGAEIPHDKYTRRGHFIGCCVGDCMPRDDLGQLQQHGYRKEEEEIEESKASSESTKSRLNAELTHKKRVIEKEERQEAKKRRFIQRKKY